MSVTTKKKHVTKEVLEDYPLPDGTKEVVKVMCIHSMWYVRWYGQKALKANFKFRMSKKKKKTIGQLRKNQ